MIADPDTAAGLLARRLLDPRQRRRLGRPTALGPHARLRRRDEPLSGSRSGGRASQSAAEMRSAHVEEYAGAGAEGLVFPAARGGSLRRSYVNRLVGSKAAARRSAFRTLHFHDLRHTGNHLAAQVPGTTVKDLMAPMGHDNERAAMIYLHRTQGADRRIADAMPVELGDADGEQHGYSTMGAGGGVDEVQNGTARPLSWAGGRERVKGIEPSLSAWEPIACRLALCRPRLESGPECPAVPLRALRLWPADGPTIPSRRAALPSFPSL